MPSEMTSLSDRIDALELENRRLRRMMTMILLLVAPVAIMAQVAVPNRIIESKQFAVVDANQRTRATLDIVTNNPELVFYDARGQARIRLGLDKNTPTLTATLPSGREIELLSEWPKIRPLTEQHDPR
jgi:hypothetical protein